MVLIPLRDMMRGLAGGVVYLGIWLVILIGCCALEPVQPAAVRGSKHQYGQGPIFKANANLQM